MTRRGCSGITRAVQKDREQGEKTVDVQDAAIAAVKIITPRKFGDQRGFFSETYNQQAFSDVGLELAFVQDNHSLSAAAGVVRGLHFQSPPFAQDKLVRVTRGAILDVAVDIRRGSPTYGQHVAVTLSAENWRQLLVPIGFAHGFVTLEENTEVQYKVTAPYAPDHDHGILWNDPALAIAWPFAADAVMLSDRDRLHPVLAALESPFAL
jgi:dTDP-4-dehydrorhamnose 3,5-epimerase